MIHNKLTDYLISTSINYVDYVTVLLSRNIYFLEISHFGDLPIRRSPILEISRPPKCIKIWSTRLMVCLVCSWKKLQPVGVFLPLVQKFWISLKQLHDKTSSKPTTSPCVFSFTNVGINWNIQTVSAQTYLTLLP